ncbi:MAG: hypothetical protein M5U01_17755 [Ardenticatenaceae bacterium]|nr:hypothetical protein [Ardenticatenaceae bacterium]
MPSQPPWLERVSMVLTVAEWSCTVSEGLSPAAPGGRSRGSANEALPEKSPTWNSSIVAGTIVAGSAESVWVLK